MVKKGTLKRREALFRKLVERNTSFRELTGLSVSEYNEIMGTHLRSEASKNAQLKVIKQIAENKESIVTEFERKDTIYRSQRMREALLEELNTRTELTNENESYYSVHLRSTEKNSKGKFDERHIFAPSLKRIDEIISLLEESYGFTYNRDHIEIVPYKEFLDRQHEEEIERRLNV